MVGMGPTIRNILKAVPLGVVLPGALAMMAVSPDDAMSNIAKWLHAVGIHQVPEWLAGNLGDSRFLGISIILSIIYAGFVWGAVPRWRGRRQPDRVPPSPPSSSQAASPTERSVPAPKLGAQEAALLEGLKNWLCPKDEGALRTEFSLINVLVHNIDLMTENHGPLTEKQHRFVNVFGDGRHVRFTQPFAVNGTYQAGDWSVNPGEIGILVLTPEYSAATARLDVLVKSAFLPEDVQKHLLQLQEVIRQNMLLAIDELNVAYKTNPKWIYDSAKMGTIYFAAVRNRYAGKLIPLRPSVDMVCGLAGRHLRNNVPR